MTRHYEFRPDWSSTPGETISDVLERKAISLAEFASRMKGSEEQARVLLDGGIQIDDELAFRLEDALSISAQFWLNRQRQYQEDKSRLETKRQTFEEREWLRALPTADMRKFGWIGYTSRAEAAKTCLEFFGVNSVGEWHSRYKKISDAVAFRTSETFRSDPGAVIAWLRRGEMVATGIKCGTWDPVLCRAMIPTLRKLTRTRSPTVFGPKLKELCSLFGVAVVIARAPNGCRASGATRFLSNNKALLLLSFRHRSDDHFWFTFFHEIGHLLLHSQSALFIEDGQHISAQEEEEANKFSSETLLPADYRPELSSLGRNFKAIVRFAKAAGVSSGIIVGQMQHYGIIEHNELNYLKTRYTW